MKKYIFLFLSLSVGLVTQAQQVNQELKQLIEKAFSYNPRLQEVEQSVTISQERSDLTKTGYVPTMNAGFTYQYVNPIGEATFPTGPGTSQTIRFQPNHNLNANVSLNYIVYDFGRLQANIRKSKEDLQMSKDNVEFQRTQLAAQVCQFYYGMIYLQKSIAIEDSLIKVLEENKRMVEAKLNNGDALKLDLLNIESSLGQEDMRKIDLKNNLDRQVVFLKYLSGEDGVSPSQANFDFSMTNQQSNSFVEQAKNMNYEFSIAKDRLKMLQSDLRGNRSQFLPYLSINGSIGFRNGYMPDIDEMRFNYAAGAGITIPILDAVKNKQQVKITKAMISQQEMSIVSLENTYRKDIELTLSDIRSGNEKLQTIQAQIDAAKEALRITVVRYKNGTSTYLELLTSAYNLQKVQMQEIQIQYNLCLSNIELARLSGTKFY